MAFPLASSGSAFADSSLLGGPDVRLLVHEANLNATPGHRAVVAGVAEGAEEGKRVVLERRIDGRWRTIARDVTDGDGAFRLRFAPESATTGALRVRTEGAQRRIPHVRVFRNALVSWYGPGFYGHPVACGGAPLGYNQLGVAHKTLPCGTKLTLRYHGRTVHVRVIDRGPYVGDREFDLTGATKDRLHFDGVGTIQVSGG
jgi:hypothetical protein